jgi:hypothetical protein
MLGNSRTKYKKEKPSFEGNTALAGRGVVAKDFNVFITEHLNQR